MYGREEEADTLVDQLMADKVQAFLKKREFVF